MTDVDDGGILSAVRRYYDGRLLAHGPTPAGVDWNSAESQDMRFEQLLRCLRLDEGDTLLDYGCGYGALADYLERRVGHPAYVGFDISSAMLQEATRLHAAKPWCRFVASVGAVEVADCVVASGLFNVKQAFAEGEWREYVTTEILRMAGMARKSISFNVLSSYSDADRRRPDLFYADPLYLFDFCKRHVGRSVTLLHDYPLYEFTLVATKGG